MCVANNNINQAFKRLPINTNKKPASKTPVLSNPIVRKAPSNKSLFAPQNNLKADFSNQVNVNILQNLFSGCQTPHGESVSSELGVDNELLSLSSWENDTNRDLYPEMA